MILGIDHIVIAVPALKPAAATYRKLGFTVVEGGRHPVGSHNALIAFQDGAYIELLAFYEDSPAHIWWDLLHKRGGGLIDFCMATDDIGADYQAFRRQGVEMSGLDDLSRKRLDGYELAWVNNKVYGKYQGLIPFIIADKTPRSERVPKATSHANGVTGIHCLSLVSDRFEPPAGIMSAVLAVEGQPIRDDELQAAGARFGVGTHRLEYLEPASEDSPLLAHLAARAPRPYRVSFKTGGAKQTFSPQQSEGVRITLV